MSYFRNLFNQALRISRLETKCEYLESLLDREETRNKYLEKQILAERKKKDDVLLRYGDQVSRQAKLPEHFVSDAEEKVEPKPPKLSQADEDQLNFLAEQMRQADMDEDGTDRGLEYYKQIIRDKGDTLDSYILT